MIIIIGAGLAGLSSSYHIGHQRCLVLERSGQAFGHIASDLDGGFTWDQGPHVSFSKNEYVRSLFADAVKGEYEEYSVKVGNYFNGHWIDHPAQTSLHQVPQPLRQQCLDSFLSVQSRAGGACEPGAPANYMEWLEQALGPTFANTFPAAYTRKYWTVDPKELGTDWVGQRMLRPNAQDVIEGSLRALKKATHYIDKVRYPKKGGYQSFARNLAQGCNIRYGSEVVSIDLKSKRVYLASGEIILFDMLVNTMPLPSFIHVCQDVPASVRDAALALSCSQLALINVAVPHETLRPENWIYVYDEDKLSTRINFTEKLTPGNAPPGWSGVQTEVYFSRHRPLAVPVGDLAGEVYSELCEMGLVSPKDFGSDSFSPTIHTRFVPWANVIFNHETPQALEVIWRWLESYGLARQPDDTHPLTDWAASELAPAAGSLHGELFMAGRFGQWKYFWSDDCVLRGRELGRSLREAGN